MGRVAALVAYKLQFFLGPAFRGRFGPLVFLGLLLVFLPQGFFLGFGLGMAVRDIDPARASVLLAAPLAGLMSFGFLWALGTGVTAHASEFDFFLTADVRPREYLVADLLFQVASVFVTGGLAASLAAVGLAVGAGRPILTALPLLAILLGYLVLVFLLVQIFIVLRVRYPKKPIRLLLVVLLVLSLVPSLALFRPDLSLGLEAVPLPSTAFGALGAAIVRGTTVAPADLVVAGLYALVFVGAWLAVSNTYIFHGIRPALSAGLGQISVSAKMDQQRRIIGGLGPLTTRVRLRADRGGDTSLMTRLHLVRILRDGSVLFIVLLAVVWTFPAAFRDESLGQMGWGVVLTQMVAFTIAILAMNWSYYERENLWIVQVATGSAASYFRGLLLGLAGIGLVMTAAGYAILTFSSGVAPPLEDAALPIAASFAAALGATAFLTRVRIAPSAFSPALLAILLVVIVTGFMAGLAAQGLVLLVDAVLGVSAAARAFVVAAFSLGLLAFGLVSVTRLGAAFRL